MPREIARRPAEAVLFVGVQASGKSTFYKERLFDTHVRVSLDLVGDRKREALLIQACLAARQAFVVDNTNVLASQRAPYIPAARAAGFRVVGYYFQTELRAALGRNRARTGKAVIPVGGVIGTYKRLQPPTLAEGFEALYNVRVSATNRFDVEEVSRAEAPIAVAPPEGGE